MIPTRYTAGLVRGALLCLAIIALPAQAQTVQEYRQTLYELTSLLEETVAITGRTDGLASAQLAFGRMQQLSDEELQSFLINTVPLTELQQALTQARLDIEEALLEQQNQPPEPPAQTRSDSVIDIPTVEVEPSFCDYATGAIAFVELAVAKIAGAILSQTEFTCLQSVAGENGAAICIALSIVDNTARLAYDNAEFCRNEQRAAEGEAILELEQNIGAHLNTFIDDVALSSRATQDSVDDLQTDIDTTTTSIDTIQDALDTGFTTIDDDLETALSDLSTLESDLTDLIALASDIQFRVQENQVDIEDVQTRAADLDESTDEIRTDTQSIISSVSSLETTVAGLETTLVDGFSQVNRDAIAAALSEPDYSVPEYALPASAGGQLEEAREVLVTAIIALQDLGIGNTVDALPLLAQGDQAYNQQDYVGAYQLFAQSYQVLTQTTLFGR